MDDTEDMPEPAGEVHILGVASASAAPPQLDMDGVRRSIAETMGNLVAPKTKQIYAQSTTRWFRWLYQHRLELQHPVVLTQYFLGGIANPTEGPTTEYIHSFLGVSINIDQPPIDIRNVKHVAEQFLTWIKLLKKEDGTVPSMSSHQTHRSALIYLYQLYCPPEDRAVRDELEAALRVFFRGRKREVAALAQEGDGAFKSGKDVMRFPLYRWMCEMLMKSNKPDAVFAHCLLTLCWNLMCRVCNGAHVPLQHLEWLEDALGVYLVHMKNDQAGDRKRDPRHIYANPVIPVICPILSLGIYLLCFPIQASAVHLFPGGNQEDRYSKVLRRMLQNNQASLNALFTDDLDIGTHSVRKGAATYATTGSTAAPSIIAVQLRAGWTLEGVQDTYMRFDNAGDCHVGRTVCGLPQDSPDFAILPPHFNGGVEPEIIAKYFGRHLPPNIRGIAPMLLASVIHHRHFLRGEIEIGGVPGGPDSFRLPSNHPLFATALFRETEATLQALEQRIITGLAQPNDPMRPTGIPPHTSLLNELRNMRNELTSVRQAMSEKLDAVENAVNASKVEVVEGVARVLEERAISANAVTPHELRNTLTDVLERSQLGVAARIIVEGRGVLSGGYAGAPVNASAPAALPNADPAPVRPLHLWGGALHFLPEGFELPKYTLPAWQFFCCGDAANGYPPARIIPRSDYSNQKVRKRLPDFHFLFNFLRAELVEMGIWVQNPTVEQANEMFDADTLWRAIVAAERSHCGRERRFAQLAWETAVSYLREYKRNEPV